MYNLLNIISLVFREKKQYFLVLNLKKAIYSLKSKISRYNIYKKYFLYEFI